MKIFFYLIQINMCLSSVYFRLYTKVRESNKIAIFCYIIHQLWKNIDISGNSLLLFLVQDPLHAEHWEKEEITFTQTFKVCFLEADTLNLYYKDTQPNKSKNNVLFI